MPVDNEQRTEHRMSLVNQLKAQAKWMKEFEKINNKCHIFVQNYFLLVSIHIRNLVICILAQGQNVESIMILH